MIMEQLGWLVVLEVKEEDIDGNQHGEGDERDRMLDKTTVDDYQVDDGKEDTVVHPEVIGVRFDS